MTRTLCRNTHDLDTLWELLIRDGGRAALQMISQYLRDRVHQDGRQGAQALVSPLSKPSAKIRLIESFSMRATPKSVSPTVFR